VLRPVLDRRKRSTVIRRSTMVIPAPLLVASPAPSKCVVRRVPTDLVERRCLFDVFSAKCAVMAVRVVAMRMFPPVRSRGQTIVISLAHSYAFITNHYRLLSRPSTASPSAPPSRFRRPKDWYAHVEGSGPVSLEPRIEDGEGTLAEWSEKPDRCRRRR